MEVGGLVLVVELGLWLVVLRPLVLEKRLLSQLRLLQGLGIGLEIATVLLVVGGAVAGAAFGVVAGVVRATSAVYLAGNSSIDRPDVRCPEKRAC